MHSKTVQPCFHPVHQNTESYNTAFGVFLNILRRCILLTIEFRKSIDGELSKIIDFEFNKFANENQVQCGFTPFLPCCMGK